MKMNFGKPSGKELAFFVVQVVLLLLSCWPGLVFGNVATTVFGIPMLLVYVFGLTVISNIVLIIQYLLDKKDGEIDFEVDPDHNYLQDIDILNNKK